MEISRPQKLNISHPAPLVSKRNLRPSALAVPIGSYWMWIGQVGCEQQRRCSRVSRLAFTPIPLDRQRPGRGVALSARYLASRSGIRWILLPHKIFASGTKPTETAVPPAGRHPPLLCFPPQRFSSPTDSTERKPSLACVRVRAR